MATATAHDELTLFLCGDVMTGRGIDQVMPHPCTPELYESYVRDARQYVALAEKANGPVEAPVSARYIWGDALDELQRVQPDFRIMNLETSITTNGSPWPRKAVHYRMHPDNVDCLKVANIDLCALANNHVLDWDYDGLADTLATLATTDMAYAGAGYNLEDAMRPVVALRHDHRVLFLSCAVANSGTPAFWAAETDFPGVFWLPDLSDRALHAITRALAPYRRGERDTVICSIHWGGNWGHDIEPERRAFAHRLIDELEVDVVHGHSSHHPQCVEVYRGKTILYGCGDFINDYEGIRGHEGYRPDLALMYFLTLSTQHQALLRLTMVPLQHYQFTLRRANALDVQWLSDTLNKSAANYGTRYKVVGNNRLQLRW